MNFALLALLLVVAAVNFVVGFFVGGRTGSRWAREDERAWERTIYRIRTLGGRCVTCGNLRAPEPMPAGVHRSTVDSKSIGETK